MPKLKEPALLAIPLSSASRLVSMSAQFLGKCMVFTHGFRKAGPVSRCFLTVSLWQ
jgi:hypothetical protein